MHRKAIAKTVIAAAAALMTLMMACGPAGTDEKYIEPVMHPVTVDEAMGDAESAAKTQQEPQKTLPKRSGSELTIAEAASESAKEPVEEATEPAAEQVGNDVNSIEPVESPEQIEDTVSFETYEEARTEQEDYHTDPDELMTPADEFAYSDMQLLGTYHITHYSAEERGNAIGAAEVPGGMIEGLSCAMPEAWMLGRTVLIEGYGFFRVDDISPDGIADIFHYSAADAVGEDWRAVYLVE